MMQQHAAPPWALVLAGGDGKRLEHLTQSLCGRPVPKQYCPLLRGRSLLETTLERIAPAFAGDRTLVVINEAHRDLALGCLGKLSPDCLLGQPGNRDTGPGIVLSLLEIERRDPGATVVVFPSDHFIDDDSGFRREVARLLATVAAHPERIALLGIRPERPDPGLGYVLPAGALARPGNEAASGAYAVRAFAEKPGANAARRAILRGALWNSFIFAFRADVMLALLAEHKPADVAALERAGRRRPAVARALTSLAPWSFSSSFLTNIPEALCLVAARDFGWSDWGTPETITRTAASYGLKLPWLAANTARASVA